MLVRSDDDASDRVAGPVELAVGIGLLLQEVHDRLENTRLAPAVEAAGHSTPGALAFRKIAPRGTSAANPQEAVADGAMVIGGPPRMRFWGGSRDVSCSHCSFIKPPLFISNSPPA
jgi:hypothetical protein